MGFEDRLKKSKITLKLFIEYCKQKNISYAFSGYEELKQSKEFKEKIKSLDSITAKRIRYFPDLIIANKEAWLIEIKNSKFIEKDAYLTYVDLLKIGYNVAIIDIYENQLLFISIDHLELNGISDNIGIPHNNIWAYPRRLPEKERIKWTKDHNGSTTDFGIIDFLESDYIILINNIEGFEKRNSNA